MSHERMGHELSRDEIVSALMRNYHISRTQAERAVAGHVARMSDFPTRTLDHFAEARATIDRQRVPTDGRLYYADVVLSNGRATVPVWPVITDAGETEAWGELLATGGVRMSVPVPPRTKKNGGRRSYFGIAKKGSAYAGYRDAFCHIVSPIVNALGLPLPNVPHNLAAQFYVDALGRAADRFGLEQALADVLQLARVVKNDWCFRTGDGTRIIADDAHPRVEFTITPLENEHGRASDGR